MSTLHTLLKPVWDDAFGGVLYNMANKDKYDTEAILAEWNKLTPAEQGAQNGLVKGAINFLTK